MDSALAQREEKESLTPNEEWAALHILFDHVIYHQLAGTLSDVVTSTKSSDRLSLITNGNHLSSDVYS